MYIIFAIIIFGLLIITHELGHFFAAKACNVRVNRFTIGLGPRLFGKKFGETDFCVCALPFGGSCEMEGEDGDSDDERSFANKTRLQKFFVLVSGAMMNLVTGVLVLLILSFSFEACITPVISGFPDELGQTNAGLLVNDKIVNIDGEHVYVGSNISYLLSRSNSETHNVTVLREGKRIKLENIPLVPRTFGDSEDLRYGIDLSIEEFSGIGSRIKYAFVISAEYARLVRLSLSDLIRGAVSVSELSGPVGITAAMSETAKEGGMGAVWQFVAFIAINLGIMNLLPIPALDGGRIFFLIVDAFLALFGKKLDPKAEGIVHLIGIVLLLALMVFVLFNDIRKLFI